MSFLHEPINIKAETKLPPFRKHCQMRALSSMKMYEFCLRFHWSLLLRLVQIMAWRRLGDKPLPEPMMIKLLMHVQTPQKLLGLYWTFISQCPRTGKYRSVCMYMPHSAPMSYTVHLWAPVLLKSQSHEIEKQVSFKKEVGVMVNDLVFWLTVCLILKMCY